MSFQDVAFLPSKASFSSTFLRNNGRGEGFCITRCAKTVVGGKQGHAPCRILLLQQSLFLCQSNLMEIMILLQRLSKICSPSVLGILPD